MKVIHIFHVFAKLSTLKRSRFKVICALKRSRLCAETLPLSIYTCIYLYKRTCSCLLQVVYNCFLTKIVSSYFVIVTAIIFISGCCRTNPSEQIQNSVLHLVETPHKHFQQYPGNKLHPSAYFTCGKYQNRCHSYSTIYSKQMQSQKINSSKLSKESKQYD